MGKAFGTKTYLALTLGLLFIILSVVMILLVNTSMRHLALTDAERAAQILLDHNLAIHTYFTQDLKPKLFERLGPITSADYFDPVWMSSTYAIRKIEGYFHHFNKYPYYYKECAINARSPENEADNYEKAFLAALPNDPKLTTKSAIRDLEGKPYFTLLRRGETVGESCLGCHSSPERAPGDLVRQYGPERSFHRNVDDVAQAISIRIPLSEAFSSSKSISFYLSGLLLVALGGGFLLVWVGNRRLLINPLAEIQDYAVRIASEHERLGETIPEPKIRELRDVVAAFNKMSVELRKTYDHQEERILERTEELSRANERLTQEITERKKAEEGARQKTNELGQRVKELNCLYGISKFVERPGISLDEIFQGVVDTIPLSWQYPEITCARIILEGREVKTENSAETVWKQSADIVVHGERVGCVEVGHIEERPARDEGPFLHQERDLLNEVAKRLGRVTEWMSAEAALRASEERFRLVAETATDVIWCLDNDYRFTYVSPADETLRGFKAEELIGQPIFTVIKPSCLEAVKEAALRRREDEKRSIKTGTLKHEFELVCKDGSHVWTEGYVTPTRDESGQIAGFVGITRDISDRIRAEQEKENIRTQLLHVQKMEAIGTLTGGIAHDFNNLLTIINGYAELILIEKTADDPIYPDLQTILETGRKGAELVQRLLAFTRKGRMNLEPLDLNVIVENSASFMRRTFPKMIEIETILEKDLGMVNGDSAQAEQLLMNLCINAKEAMPEDGRIRIETRNILVDGEYCRLVPGARPGRCVLIEISDTGAGMCKETMDRMFDPFFTTKGWDFKKGTGLGLSVAKGIVDQHGGWMTCESELGKGTTFRLYFPVIEAPRRDEEAESLTEIVSDGEKILLVDDEKHVRELGKGILERAGYTVITASNGNEALEVYAREQPDIDLVVLDLIMPQMSGPKCLEEMLKINPQAKVIISTGYSLAAQEHLQVESLVRGFVNKPYVLGRMVRAVKRALKAEGPTG